MPSCLVAFVTCIFISCSFSFAANPPNVMVHGAGRTTGPNPVNPVWIANIITDPKDPAGPGTQILYREKIGDDKWQEFSRIAFRASEITSESSELVILKDNRVSWAWFSGSAGGGGTRFSYGPELPNHQKILAIAGDRKNLYAIGLPTGRSTQATTTQASSNPATMPATRPGGPLLHQLATGGWTALESPLPPDITLDNPDHISMAIINETPMLALSTGDQFVQLLQYSRSAKRWEKKERIDGGRKPVQWFKMLSLANQPAVWVWADVEGSLGQIWTANNRIELPEIAGITLGDADVTISGDTVWLVYRTNQGKLFQQRFNLDGTRADDQPKLVDFLKVGNIQGRHDWMAIGAMTMLTLLILIALLRRRAAAQKDDEGESEE